MNSKLKRILVLALTLVLLLGVVGAPALAWWPGQSGSLNPYPTVMVHGLLGWGFNDGINNIVPYWGMTTGSVQGFLNEQGYETYAASVGPISSAWDRACELYAQLVGGTVDYGAAHSASYGHDRYGITYDSPLFEDWSAEKKINLIGHSFGGATMRLFVDVLADGCGEEIAAAPDDCSEFFMGGKGDWVFSMTSLAAPHNGTTFIEANGDETVVLSDICIAFSKAMGLTELKGIYDFQLEHFGIYGDYNETPYESLERVLNSDFLAQGDHAWIDLQIDGALAINDDIEIRDQIYYFSYAGDKTNYNRITQKYTPALGMWPIFMPFSAKICNYYDQYTDGGVYISRDWLPNDGMVNTISAKYPTNSAGICVNESGVAGFTHYAGTDSIQPGTWYVMPVERLDHMGFAGGIVNNSGIYTRILYMNIMGNLDDAYNESIA